MYIQSINGVEKSPSCKALYFTKTPTIMVDKTAEFMSNENVTTTKKGIRYLKDNTVPQNIRERFANNKFVKKMARKYDTFIWFVQSKSNEGFRTWAKIMRVKNGQEELSNHYVIGKSLHTQNMATENMFTALKDKNFIVM